MVGTRMLGQRAVDRAPRRGGGAMQEGFGGLNIATSGSGGAGDRAARGGRRRSHQGALRPDAGRLQGDRRYGAQEPASGSTRTSTPSRTFDNALDAGVDVLQHVGSAGTAPPYSKELITDIVNAGRPVVVTAAHRAWM